MPGYPRPDGFVEAMFAGKVSKIHCSVGDLVDQDQLLVVLA